MSYTNGPWETYGDDVRAGTRHICAMYRHLESIGGAVEMDDEDIANAELIATAPEQQAKIDALLAACKALDAIIDLSKPWHRGDLGIQDVSVINMVLEQLRNAIAKAES